MSRELFKKVYSQRKSEYIVDQIYEAILRGDLKPNERFSSESELADMFGVSKLTVRESIRSLEQIGIVEVHKGNRGGIYVKEMNLEIMARQIENVLRNPLINIVHLNEARLVIEKSILQDILRSNITEEVIDRLENNVRMTEHYYEQGMNRERLASNFEFHFIIASITKNPILIIMSNVIDKLLYQFFEAVKPTKSMGLQTLEEHRSILNAIKKKNLHEAEKLCISHIERVGRMIIQKSKEQSNMKSMIGRRKKRLP